MRAPMEKGLRAMRTPRAFSASKVSRALWPMASTTPSAGRVSRAPSAVSRIAAAMRPPSTSSPTSRVSKRTSPPRETIFSRSAFTTPGSRSVPMWGLARYRISSGAPHSQRILSAMAQRGSLMPVVSLPSENAPAPPSPNCTFERGLNAPPDQKDATAAARRATSCPRSTTMGRAPLSASVYAANSPAGPRPTTTGRFSNRAPEIGRRTGSGLAGAACTPRGSRARTFFSSPRSATSSAMTKWTSPLSRASTDFFATRALSTSPRAFSFASAAFRSDEGV